MSQLRRRNIITKSADSGYKLPDGYAKVDGVYTNGAIIDFGTPTYPYYCVTTIAPNVIPNSDGVIIGRTDNIGVWIKGSASQIKAKGNYADGIPIQSGETITIYATLKATSGTRITVGSTSLTASGAMTYKDKILFGAGWVNGNSRAYFNVYDFELWTYDELTTSPVELVHKLVPCIRESDSTYGVYDVITDTFKAMAELKTNFD